MVIKLKPKAIVFDLDGVLVDCSERYRLCLQEANGKRNKRFWECFLSEKYMDLDQPNTETIETLREYYRRGYRIIILTGRVKEKQENKTKQQLKQYNIEAIYEDNQQTINQINKQHPQIKQTNHKTRKPVMEITIESINN